MNEDDIMDTSLEDNVNPQFESLATRNLIEKSKSLKGSHPQKAHLDVLQRFFGHKSFRPMQWAIINSLINDRRDNCVIMATGYGKSLCYQYPSVFCGGVTVVISPLISLMEDQVLSLNVANISACLLGSAQTKQREVVDNILENKYTIVYMTPEFCCGDYGQSILRSMDQNLSITLIAVDEAHCVSMWGHDFRHQYRQLGSLRTLLPHVPILAVTATATEQVRNDIIKSLKLDNPQVLCSGFDRPNLYFSVFTKGKGGVVADLRKHMVKENGHYTFPGSTIIYCITRKQTEEVAQILKGERINCEAYHAGLTIKQRKDVHEFFVRDKVNVIAATIAFGMGIDKPDVRTVIHYGTSRDIESYYQEVGRAGRDGQPSVCVTYYCNSDFNLLESIRELGNTSSKRNEQKDAKARLMLKYLETSECRRDFILEYFEGKRDKARPKEKCCDNCTRKLRPQNNEYTGIGSDGLYDFTEDFRVFLSAVDVMGGRFGMGMYILFIRGSNSSKLFEKYLRHPLHGLGKGKSEEWWKCIGSLLDTERYLEKVKAKTQGKFLYSTMKISEKGKKFLDDLERNRGVKVKLKPGMQILNLLKKPKEIPVPTKTTKLKTTIVSGNKSTAAETDWIETTPEIGQFNANKKPKLLEIDSVQKQKTYALLLNKRTELAYDFDCMPYMIASNEVMMQIATHQPITMKQLKELNLDGFTEAKINKFGKELINTVRFVRGLQPEEDKKITSREIIDILSSHPLPDEAKMGGTAEVTYSLYKDGRSPSEIAQQRKLTIGTVHTHLIQAMKLGHPVKLRSLGVNGKVKKIVEGFIVNPPINMNLSNLSRIKQLCPPEIKYDQIKAVGAYLAIRNHLNDLNCEYDDFEDIDDENLDDDLDDTVIDEEKNEINDGNVQRNEANGGNVQNIDDDELSHLLNDTSAEENSALNCLVDEIENGNYDYNNFGKESVEHKPKKSRLSLLDSPPPFFR